VLGSILKLHVLLHAASTDLKFIIVAHCKNYMASFTPKELFTAFLTSSLKRKDFKFDKIVFAKVLGYLLRT
jgi:hypothetical protein